MAKLGRPTAAERALRLARELDAAVALFTQRGFGGTSLDEVASIAGVTKRTLYSDFGDKRALFAAAVEREHDRIRVVASERGSLRDVATETVFRLHSDTAVALHRSVIAEALRFPDLARDFYASGPQHSIDLLAGLLPLVNRDSAAALYSLLLGEKHRRRLLELDPAPSRSEAGSHARASLAVLGLV